MKNTILLSIICIFFASAAQAQNGGVAVLDIDEVAKELGVEETVKVELQDLQNKLNEELQKTQTNLQEQMKELETKAGDNPTDEQKRELVQANQQLNAEFNRLRAQAQQTIAAERAKKIQQFQEKLRPIALDAADKLGLKVILMKISPPVFAHADEVDITKDTIDRAIKAGLKVEPPAPAPAAGDEKGKGK